MEFEVFMCKKWLNVCEWSLIITADLIDMEINLQVWGRQVDPELSLAEAFPQAMEFLIDSQHVL